eukprot:TRINITY_DN3124_c0_g1_i1.p1 TRINITY_DN3124_c0_g1~~TRINITY_DN3124_c0_g1_i1.p1  ORF type:complete len:205 (+),score=23.54 TRINITY_DN3124_c0_g1_i1:559-1173(+)
MAGRRRKKESVHDMFEYFMKYASDQKQKIIERSKTLARNRNRQLQQRSIQEKERVSFEMNQKRIQAEKCIKRVDHKYRELKYTCSYSHRNAKLEVEKKRQYARKNARSSILNNYHQCRSDKKHLKSIDIQRSKLSPLSAIGSIKPHKEPATPFSISQKNESCIKSLNETQCKSFISPLSCEKGSEVRGKKLNMKTVERIYNLKM